MNHAFLTPSLTISEKKSAQIFAFGIDARFILSFAILRVEGFFPFHPFVYCTLTNVDKPVDY